MRMHSRTHAWQSLMGKVDELTDLTVKHQALSTRLQTDMNKQGKEHQRSMIELHQTLANDMVSMEVYGKVSA